MLLLFFLPLLWLLAHNKEGNGCKKRLLTLSVGLFKQVLTRSSTTSYEKV